MANYSLVINSKFKPFSYQELLQPALMATQAHQAIEDAYGELDTKASIWDNLTEGSTKAKALYQRFAEDLAKEAEQLSKYGLSPTSRQAMLNMRGRYSKDIVPIEQAYANRKAQADEQRKALLADPTLLLSRRADSTNLDEYLDNPNLGYDAYSGALLAQEVSTAAAALAKAARNDPKVQTELRHLLGFQYETIRRKGFSPEEVQKAILNAEGANPELTGIVDKVLESSGIGKWNMSEVDRKALMKQARAYANPGLWSAVGETQYGTVTDDRAKALFEDTLIRQRAADARKQAIEDAKNQPIVPKFDRRNVRTSKEMAETVRNLGQWDEFRQYFYKTDKGNWAINAKGRELYKKGKDVENSSSGAFGVPVGTISLSKNAGWDLPSAKFYNFVNSVGMSEAAQGRRGPNQTQRLDAFLDKNVRKQYDANQATEYYVPIKTTDYDNVMSAIGRASADNKINTYSRVKKGNTYQFVRDKNARDIDFETKDILDASAVYGQHGNYMEITLKGGEKLHIPYSSLNGQFNDMVTGSVNDAIGLMKAKEQGITQVQGPYGVESIDVAINRALNSAGDNFMSGLSVSTIKDQETTRGLYQFNIPSLGE